MASIRKRKDYYYIRFFRIEKGKKRQVEYSLGTTSRDEAISLKLEYENKYRLGRIDPFNGWSPKKEIEVKRYNHWGKYIHLKDAIDHFIKERSYLGENTLKSYRRHMNLFMNTLSPMMPVTTINELHIRNFCLYPTLKPTTQATYIRNLKVFFNWLHLKHIISESPLKNVRAPFIPKTTARKVVSENELKLLFDIVGVYWAREQKKYRFTKPLLNLDWFAPMISTIYYCGLRAGEMVNLQWEHVSFKENNIRIINCGTYYTKTRQERVVPIRKPLRPILVEWHLYQGEPGNGYVFPRPTGINQNLKMDTIQVSKTFKRFIRMARLPDEISLHGLRHSCATDLLRKGMPIHLVSKFLGHSQVSTTQIYDHLNEKDMEKVIRKIE